MEKIVNFQLSLFGSFIKIEPSQEVGMRLMANLIGEKMVPGTVNISSIDPINKKVETETRLQMVSQDKMWKIVFLPDRIDVSYDYMGGDNYYSSLNAAFEHGIQLLQKTFLTFKNTTGNRIAANARIILPAMDKSEENDFIHRFMTPVSFLKDKNLDEWNIHYNIKKEVQISETKSEICNNIIDIGNIIGMDTQTGKLHQRMSIGLDLNTLPENHMMRFKYTDLVSFAYYAEKEMENILKSIEEG